MRYLDSCRALTSGNGKQTEEFDNDLHLGGNVVQFRQVILFETWTISFHFYFAAFVTNWVSAVPLWWFDAPLEIWNLGSISGCVTMRLEPGSHLIMYDKSKNLGSVSYTFVLCGLGLELGFRPCARRMTSLRTWVLSHILLVLGLELGFCLIYFCSMCLGLGT